MTTRKAVWATILVVCCVAAGFGRPYELIQTGRNVGVFTNESGTAFVGLRVVFTAALSPLQAIGIGATLRLLSNEDGNLIYSGTIIPFGMFQIDWSLNGPRIDAAYWIDANGVEWPIDVHSPYARMRFEVPRGSDAFDDGCVPCLPIRICAQGRCIPAQPDAAAQDGEKLSISPMGRQGRVQVLHYYSLPEIGAVHRDGQRDLFRQISAAQREASRRQPNQAAPRPPLWANGQPDPALSLH